MEGRFPVWAAGPPGMDLADPGLYTGTAHLEMWREARARHPVAWTESPLAGGFWSVTTHRECEEVLGRPDTFISEQGMRLGSNPAGVRAAAGRMLVVSDGAAQARLRAAHQVWLGSRSVMSQGVVLRERVAARLDELLARGAAFDAVGELTARVPQWVLLDMLGVPRQDWDSLTVTMAEAFDHTDPGPEAEAARTAAHARIFAYFDELLDMRREQPGDDIVSALAHANPGGTPLTDEEILLNCDGLMNGGLETVPHALAGALLLFARQPGLWERLRSEPRLIGTTVEEIVRWTSPALHAMRTAVRETSIGDVTVRSGDRVVLWYPSANLDERVFPNPDTFLPDRRPNPHIAFGAGAHYCVGAALARLELRCLLEVMAGRVATVELAGEPVRRASNFLQGFDRLEVVMKPH
ncbi:cytochrome P450 [Streptomyces sp. NPDC059850]|uniref:cytochrome P450 n=1 Tax=Streptomyces sp. NPDC059850 TaxID=3346970 RepID=UPI0036467BDC